MPSVKVLEMKQEVVSEIKDKLSNCKSFVLFDYRGLTDGETKDLNIDLDSYLEGPTAIAFSKDDIAAIKVLSECSKKNDALVLKAGMVEGNMADKDKLDEFAKIPSREGLYTMLAGGMIQIAKDLSVALNLYAEQKEN